MRKLVLLFFIVFISCQKEFNKHITGPGILEIKNHFFLKKEFLYGMHNNQTNTVILILDPDNYTKPTRFNYLTIRNPNKTESAINTLKKQNIFNATELIKIEEWINFRANSMKKINMNEILVNEEKKLNLDLENEVINSIVLQYINSIPQRNAQRISSEVEKINKELDDKSPENLRNLKSRGDKLLNELFDDNNNK